MYRGGGDNELAVSAVGIKLSWQWQRSGTLDKEAARLGGDGSSRLPAEHPGD